MEKFIFEERKFDSTQNINLTKKTYLKKVQTQEFPKVPIK